MTSRIFAEIAARIAKKGSVPFFPTKRIQIASIVSIIFLFAQCCNAETNMEAELGDCVPTGQERGPWNCKIKKPLVVTCQKKKDKKYDAVWSLVRNENDAAVLLNSMYVGFASPLKFSEWLSCQGFEVTLYSKSALGYSGQPENESLSIKVVYHVADGNLPFPLSWGQWILKPSIGDFAIAIDIFGEIKTIKHGYTFE
jgi:hypothetical protein